MRKKKKLKHNSRDSDEKNSKIKFPTFREKILSYFFYDFETQRALLIKNGGTCAFYLKDTVIKAFYKD